MDTRVALAKGDRVVPSGVGRTARWPATPGTVLDELGLDGPTVAVQWDGTSFSDEMALAEIRLIEVNHV